MNSHVIKNSFLVIAKLGHECFKLNLLSASECLLEFVIKKIDTSSSSLKMATLSTLSACYWRLGKFVDSIECMNSELKIASNINENANRNNTNLNDLELNETFNFNRYRIYGNLVFLL